MRKDMDWNEGKDDLCLPTRCGGIRGQRRLAEELVPARRQMLRTSMVGLMPLASDAGRKAVAAAKANVQTWRANAYQAYWRTQIR